MNTSSLTSTHLKHAIELLAKKESLQTQLAGIDAQVAALLGGASIPTQKATATAKVKPGKPGAPKSKGRGALKASILAELKSAGSRGVSVKDLVEKLNSKSANLHAWFNMTGKKMGGIEKIGRGVYRLAA